ncbi:MAG TPA: hypothetical protein VIS48_13045 [Candidatus Kryptonia bacterium]
MQVAAQSLNSAIHASEEPKEFDKKTVCLSISPTVGLSPGKETASEVLYLVALKKRVDFCLSDMTRESVGIVPIYRAAILELQQ